MQGEIEVIHARPVDRAAERAAAVQLHADRETPTDKIAHDEPEAHALLDRGAGLRIADAREHGVRRRRNADDAPQRHDHDAARAGRAASAVRTFRRDREPVGPDAGEPTDERRVVGQLHTDRARIARERDEPLAQADA